MLYICHFFCLRVYALHFRGKEKHIPKLDVMTFHSHPPIRISRLSSEAGWCPSGRVFGGSVEASWHHLQSFATTLGWGALGGGHNSWSPKKRDGQGVLKLLKGLNCHYNEWWFVGSSWKVWVLLGFWGCRLVRSLGWSSHSSTFHVSNSRFPKVSEGFRRIPNPVQHIFRTVVFTFSFHHEVRMLQGTQTWLSWDWHNDIIFLGNVNISVVAPQFLDNPWTKMDHFLWDGSMNQASQDSEWIRCISSIGFRCLAIHALGLRAGKQQTQLYSRPLKGTMPQCTKHSPRVQFMSRIGG